MFSNAYKAAANMASRGRQGPSKRLVAKARHQGTRSVTQVAIIGGGLSGLACAGKLRELGLTSVVFDTGKSAAGGRCSSREINEGGHTLRFDHSMQCFSVSNEAFRPVVQAWLESGFIKEWRNSTVGVLNAGGAFEPRPADAPPLYVGIDQGNRTIVDNLSKGVEIKRPVWVSKVERQSTGTWEAYEYNDFQGAFDYVVIAHNGKCADRLMSKAGVPAVHKLLRVKFQPAASPAPVMQLCSIWALMVAFPQSLGLDFEGAFVKDVPELSWVANNTAKLSTEPLTPDQPECWTLFSSRSFGTAHKCPQEFVPPEKDAEVKKLMLSAFEKAVGRKLGEPLFMRTQLWGAAVPMNVLDTPEGCVMDGEVNVGICGDWLMSPSLEGAVLSGISMAKRIAKHASGEDTSSVGLDGRFRILSTPAIGDFPGTGLKNEEPAPQFVPRRGRGGRRGGQRRGRGGRGGRQPQSDFPRIVRA